MKIISRISNLSLPIILLAFVSLISCKKETSNKTEDESFASLVSSEADAESEIIFNEIFDNVMGVNNDVGLAGVGVFGMASPGSSGEMARTTACPDVTKTHLNPPDVFPVKIVLDFGSGCVGRDGRLRAGKIITVYTNRLIFPNAKATTTFENFSIDSIKVQGTQIITNLSELSSTNTVINKWKVVIEGAKLTKPNGNYVEWNSTRTITQLEGMNTPDLPLDDIYKIEGSSTGKVMRGNILIGWHSEITEPLIKKFNCRWIVKGTIRVVRLNLSNTSSWAGAINYGDGRCDNKAVVVINGVSHEITLP